MLTDSSVAQVFCDGSADEEVYAQCPIVNKGCMFWNETSRGWSSYGCRHVPSDNDDEVVCICNHLTDFSTLEASLADITSHELTGMLSSAHPLVLRLSVTGDINIYGLYARELQGGKSCSWMLLGVCGFMGSHSM